VSIKGQGIKESSMAGPSNTLGSPWTPLAIHPCFGLHFFWLLIQLIAFILIGTQRRVPKGVEDGSRPLALWAGHPRNGQNAVSGVARPQGIEGLGIAGTSDISGSPWPPLAIHP
jgi:hypothetical protein